MALETVQITILNDDVGNTPIEGLVVRIFDVTGTTFITSATTDAAGLVDFTLDGDDPAISYTLRGSKTGVVFPNPVGFDVYSPPANSPTGTNTFEVEAHVVEMPESVNPYLCRVSGYIRRADGRVLPGLDVHFIPCFDPLIVEGAAILGERVYARSDSKGYVEFDLYRNGMYSCVVESLEDLQRDITVPDAPAVNFADLVFPVVASVTFDPPGPLALNEGDTQDVVVTVTTSAGVVLSGPAFGDVGYTPDDADVASAVQADGGSVLRIVAGSPGSTTVRAIRLDESIVHVPDPGISGGELDVVVS